MSGLWYEWDCELVAIYRDENGDEIDNDIIEHDHRDTFKEVRALAATGAPAGHEHHIVLVRTDDNSRSWAYLGDDGKLPEYFEDAYGKHTSKVPQRYHDEVFRAGPSVVSFVMSLVPITMGNYRMYSCAVDYAFHGVIRYSDDTQKGVYSSDRTDVIRFVAKELHA
jgi:hypothetical protein